MKKKTILWLLLSCFITLTLVVESCSGAKTTDREQEEYIFPDPNLEAAIRDEIGKPTGNIYQSDLVGITDLNARDRGITDLTGLEYKTASLAK